MPSGQVMRFQTMAPTGREDHGGVDDARRDDAGADGGGDVQAEHSEGDEIEEGRPEHGILRAQHAGRDDGRDRIGGVVQAIEEVEQQRDRDQNDQNRKSSVASTGLALP